MHWLTNSRDLLDLVSEQVAIRTGLLLLDSDIRSILAESDLKSWVSVLDFSNTTVLRVRPELPQDMIRVVRAAVGNLPDAAWGSDVASQHMQENREAKVDNTKIIDAIWDVMATWPTKHMDADFAKAVAEKSGEPIVGVSKLLLGMGAVLDRDTPQVPHEGAWDGVQPLSDLFDTETAPSDPHKYLDQKFLDYLAANESKLEKIHWRNFERLTAEYFNREKYDVELGPGRNDGGVDLRVWPKGEKHEGPPLILIQCKRLSGSNTVAVQFVKALWTDVVFEGSKRGLIATTSSISPIGKRTATARAYPLDFAEADDVKKWVTSMWRHSWTAEAKKVVVGKYLLPPVTAFETEEEDPVKETTKG